MYRHTKAYYNIAMIIAKWLSTFEEEGDKLLSSYAYLLTLFTDRKIKTEKHGKTLGHILNNVYISVEQLSFLSPNTDL